MNFMLKINTNTTRYEATQTDIETTIAQALDNRGVSTTGASVNLNGRILRDSEFDYSFADLGVKPGDLKVLSVVVKADSAR